MLFEVDNSPWLFLLVTIVCMPIHCASAVRSRERLAYAGADSLLPLFAPFRPVVTLAHDDTLLQYSSQLYN